MFGSGSSPAFGAGFSSMSGSSPLFGSSNPAFGSSTTTPFGAGSSLSLFGSSTSQSAFGLQGTMSSPFGQPKPSPVFGQTQPSFFGQSTMQQASPFGQTSSFGQTQSSIFGGVQSYPSGQIQTPFGVQSSSFGQTQQSTPGFGQTQLPMFGNPQQSIFSSSQLTTQMAPVAPMAIPLPDRDIQAIVDAYKDEAGNPKYSFKSLLLSVTDQSMRVKPIGVSDIMWAEAMNKLEGMESADRERLWPELIQGFKDLSHRLKLQDEAIASDTQRLRTTQTNVKLLERHFQVDTLTWIQRLRHKEKELQRRLLRVMRIVEALEGKGFRMPTTKGEAYIGEHLRTLARQLQAPGAELPRRVYTLLSISRMQAQVEGAPALLPGLAKIDEQSLGDMFEVLRRQTEAISSLVNILKKDMRNTEIIMSEDTEMLDEPVESDSRRSGRNGILLAYSGNV
uniref:TSA: Wollemia nobilis Ref_Wollemi_Transcript_29119_1885 transcribed RNA sequence n=1 Tax=Wollemia nobilis TaxID=56998 RepID=A0A0C9S0R4_9CONI